MNLTYEFDKAPDLRGTQPNIVHGFLFPVFGVTVCIYRKPLQLLDGIRGLFLTRLIHLFNGLKGQDAVADLVRLTIPDELYLAFILEKPRYHTVTLLSTGPIWVL